MRIEARVGPGWARFETYLAHAGRERSISLRDSARVREAFERVGEITRALSAASTGQWVDARFILNRDGDFEIDFGYPDKPLFED
jgi:hypothetical protein